MLNKKGIAISSIIYSILILFLMLIFGILSLLGSRKLTFDKFKSDVMNELNNSTNSGNNDNEDTDPETIYTFDFTGDVQEFMIPANSSCKLEVWGAQGGNTPSREGGTGGYSVGNLTVDMDTYIYVYVGGQGTSDIPATSGKKTGGFNGGGNGYGGNGGRSAGGGATDIRIGTDSLYARVIVAGGGGGAVTYGTSSYISGIGGGTSGTDSGGKGGTQTAGGTGNSTVGWIAAKFGFGGNCNTCTTTLAGGGGGWYGGGSGNAGGGGSGWIFTETNYNAGYTSSSYTGDTWLLGEQYYLTNAETIAGNQEIPTYDGKGVMVGNTGDGYAKLTCTSSEPDTGPSMAGEYVYEYTNAVQTLNVTSNTTCELKLWGAKGGAAYYSNTLKIGATGGYSQGVVNLKKDDILYVYVGGAGGNAESKVGGAGGFNGGATAHNHNGRNAGGGGGASDIRINNDSLYARLIVAGGGGAGAPTTSAIANTTTIGGAGGGDEGQKGQYNPVINTTTTYQMADGRGGTQIAGGIAGSYSDSNTSIAAAAGTFGFGGSGNLAGSWSGAGGGGGWYGGGGGTYTGGGGGGSGWVFTQNNYNAGYTNSSYTGGTWLLDQYYFLNDAFTLLGNDSLVPPIPSTDGSGYIVITCN